MNLAEHKKKWINCQRCTLYSTRKFVVLGKGQLPCDVLFIGEAPGVSENVRGIPFDGPAGDELTKLINRACEIGADYAGEALEFSSAFTNLIACIPLGNDGHKTEQPTDESLKACRPRLVEFAKLANPKLVVLVGTLSVKHMPPEILKGRKWCIIDHPAFILRVRSERPDQYGLILQRNVVTLADAFRELTV